MNGKNQNSPAEVTTIEDWFRSASIKASPGLPLPGRTYESLFWRPYLGLVPFTFWEVLCSYGYFVRTSGEDWPTIEMLSDSLGYGTRFTILGRNEAVMQSGKVNPAQPGIVEKLVEERICHHWTRGADRQTVHYFDVLDDLPVLTPQQVRTLSVRKQVEHKRYLDYFRGFNRAVWEASEEATFIPGGWWLSP